MVFIKILNLNFKKNVSIRLSKRLNDILSYVLCQRLSYIKLHYYWIFRIFFECVKYSHYILGRTAWLNIMAACK